MSEYRRRLMSIGRSIFSDGVFIYRKIGRDKYDIIGMTAEGSTVENLVIPGYIDGNVVQHYSISSLGTATSAAKTIQLPTGVKKIRTRWNNLPSLEQVILWTNSGTNMYAAIDFGDNNTSYISNPLSVKANCKLSINAATPLINTITVTPSTQEVKDFTFYKWDGLQSLIVVSNNTLGNISYTAFAGCKNLTSITGGTSTGRYQTANNCLIDTRFRDSGKFVNVLLLGCKNSTIPTTVTHIAETAFTYCTGLTSITIPSNVEYIYEQHYIYGAFYGCKGLTSITVNRVTPPTILNIGGGHPTDVGTTFNDTNNCPIYVPSASVSAYKTAWPEYAERIQAIA